MKGHTTERAQALIWIWNARVVLSDAGRNVRACGWRNARSSGNGLSNEK